MSGAEGDLCISIPFKNLVHVTDATFLTLRCPTATQRLLPAVCVDRRVETTSA